jgi:hypothetical protein
MNRYIATLTTTLFSAAKCDPGSVSDNHSRLRRNAWRE